MDRISNKSNTQIAGSGDLGIGGSGLGGSNYKSRDQTGDRGIKHRHRGLNWGIEGSNGGSGDHDQGTKVPGSGVLGDGRGSFIF